MLFSLSKDMIETFWRGERCFELPAGRQFSRRLSAAGVPVDGVSYADEANSRRERRDRESDGKVLRRLQQAGSAAFDVAPMARNESWAEAFVGGLLIWLDVYMV
jgi:hypothetical protein